MKTAKKTAQQPKPFTSTLPALGSFVERNHEAIASLSLALEEIEYQYATFSTEAVTEYTRKAIVDQLGEHCKRQSEDLEKLLDGIKALDQPAAAAPEGGKVHQLRPAG